MPVTSLNPTLLRGRARRSARVIAQARLQRVLEEAARVEVRTGLQQLDLPGERSSETADPEAIHDFRVALRRLRAWLRAFRPYLDDTVRRGPERRLRSLSRLAGRARDLEVQLRWLSKSGTAGSGPAREAARWLAERMSREQPKARRALRKGLLAELPDAGARLAQELGHYRRKYALEDSGDERMATEIARALRQASDTLVGDLQRIRRSDQVEEAHAARIAIKRMRYLLEGFGEPAPNATSVLRQLTALQHLFGELHDAQVLERRLRELRDERQRGRSDSRGDPGRPSASALKALHAVLSRRVATAFRQIDRAIRSHATGEMFTQLDALFQRLELLGRNGGPGPSPAETDR